MRTVPNIPPPTPAGVAKPGLRYPAPPLKLSFRARAALDYLHAVDASATALGMRRPVAPTPSVPLTLTDWSARIADAFGAIESATVQLASNTRRALDQTADSYVYGIHRLTEPFLANLVELRAVQLVTWRQLNAETVTAFAAPFADALVRKAQVAS